MMPSVNRNVFFNIGVGITISLILVCTGVFYFYRKKHQLQVRAPGLSITLSLWNAAAIFGYHTLQLEGMPCQQVHWIGNIFMNYTMVLSSLRMWSINVLSDRDLRKRFRWTLKLSWLLSINVALLIYTIIVTAMSEELDKGYLKIVNEKKCYFLLPWKDYIPLAVPFVFSRIFCSAKVKSSATRDKKATKDYYGIAVESKFANALGFPIAILYFIYAQYCLVGKLDGNFPPSYVLIALPACSSLAATVVPAFKVLMSVKKGGKRQKARGIFRVASNKSKIVKKHTFLLADPKRLLQEILHDDKRLLKFRRHAQKALCAENVDFCLEIQIFKSKADRLSRHGVDTTLIKTLHENFLAITKEFILDGSPCEVNLSHTQKKHILQYIDFQNFSLLTLPTIHSVFDEAKVEIEKILQENLLDKFLDKENDF